MTGNVETENWRERTRDLTYHDLAQYTQHVLMKSGLTEVQNSFLNDQLFEYGLLLTKDGKEVGKVGKVKNSLLKDFSIKQELFYADLDTFLLFRYANPKFVIQDVPKFPEVRRDLSLVIDKRVTFDEIQNLVRSTEKRLIKSIIVFDVYEGEKVPADKKAYALGFTLQDDEKTLTDLEIEKTMTRLMAAFEQKLGATIRK
jgi:phenylalanyl-tRNA synthetase beta chain